MAHYRMARLGASFRGPPEQFNPSVNVLGET
jgi:hypothetical protein